MNQCARCGSPHSLENPVLRFAMDDVCGLCLRGDVISFPKIPTPRQRCTGKDCRRTTRGLEFDISYCCEVCMDFNQLRPKTKKGIHPAVVLHHRKLHSEECDERNR